MKPVLPPAGPECAGLADLLPLSAQNLLTSEQFEAVQKHAHGCAHCQATLDLYARLDDAVRRYAGIGSATPSLSAQARPSVMESTQAQHILPALHRRRWQTTLGAVVVTLIITGLLAALLLTRAGIGSNIGGVIPHPHGGTQLPWETMTLSALDMRTPDDGWAAGQVTEIIPSPATPLPAGVPLPLFKTVTFFLHYNGTSWREYPIAANVVITGISMISADAGWAVGHEQGIYSYDILQYQHGQWRVMSHYNSMDAQEYILHGIAMMNATTGWIVGTSAINGDHQQPLLLRYHGGQWVPVALADTNAYELNAITMSSANEGWAVGTADINNNQRSAYILHYQNGSWQRVGIGEPGLLYDVAEISPGNVWAVGSVTPSSGSIVLHYQAGIWQRVSVPTPNILHAVAFTSPADGWILGDGEVTLHYDGSTWSNIGIVRHGFEIEQVSVEGPDDAWAIGSYIAGGPQTNTTITLLHYSAGQWRVYPLTSVVATP
jgi:hypothetical protein